MQTQVLALVTAVYKRLRFISIRGPGNIGISTAGYPCEYYVPVFHYFFFFPFV